MITGERDPRYPEAYYPYYNPDLHRADGPPKPRDFSLPLNRYTHPVYSLDQKPYSGITDEYRSFFVPDVSTKVV